MSLKAPKSDIIPLEGGSYPARLLSVIGLGLQAQRAWQGEEKPPKEEIMMIYELSDEFMNDDPKKPRVLNEWFPFHNLSSELAKSTKRYMAMDSKLEYDGDFAQLIGTPVSVVVVQNPGKGGIIYNNVAGVNAMRPKDAEKLPPLVNPSVVFDFDSPDPDMWEAMYPWVKDRIRKSLNYSSSQMAAWDNQGDPSLLDDPF